MCIVDDGRLLIAGQCERNHAGLNPDSVMKTISFTVQKTKTKLAIMPLI